MDKIYVQHEGLATGHQRPPYYRNSTYNT